MVGISTEGQMKERILNGIGTVVVLGLIFVFRPGQQIRKAITGPAAQQTTTQQAR